MEAYPGPNRNVKQRQIDRDFLSDHQKGDCSLKKETH